MNIVLIRHSSTADTAIYERWAKSRSHQRKRSAKYPLHKLNLAVKLS